MDTVQILQQRQGLATSKQAAVVEDAQAQAAVLVRNRAAMAQALQASDNLSPSGRASVNGVIEQQYQDGITALRRKAEAELEAERTRLEKLLRTKQAAAIKTQRGLYAELSPAELAVMQATIQASNVSEMATFYDQVAVDPAAAITARRLIAAYWQGKAFDPNEAVASGRLERRFDADQAVMDTELTKVQADLDALKIDAKLIAELDPAGRALELNQRFNLTAPTLVIPSDLTPAEQFAAKNRLKSIIAELK